MKDNPSSYPTTTAASSSSSEYLKESSKLPVSSTPDVEIVEGPAIKEHQKSVQQTKPCIGVHINLPEGQSPHTTYLFGLHDMLADPWDYAVVQEHLILCSRSCTAVLLNSQGICHACISLRNHNGNLAGIMRRLKKGVHKNSQLIYNGIGNLVTIVRAKEGQIQALQLCN